MDWNTAPDAFPRSYVFVHQRDLIRSNLLDIQQPNQRFDAHHSPNQAKLRTIHSPISASWLKTTATQNNRDSKQLWLLLGMKPKYNDSNKAELKLQTSSKKRSLSVYYCPHVQLCILRPNSNPQQNVRDRTKTFAIETEERPSVSPFRAHQASYLYWRCTIKY